MAISFTKTTWVDLSSPYIDASQLNRIETVLDALVNGSSRAVWRDGDTMTGALTLSAGNLNVSAGAIQTAGVTRISNGGAGTLTTLTTTGLADLASARVQNLAASQMVATNGNRDLVSWDAATARNNLGIVGADRIDRSLKSATASGWYKLATVRVSAIAHVSQFMAEVVSAGRSTGTADNQRARLFVRLKQNNALTGAIDVMQCEYTSEGGTSFTFGYSVVQNDATAKVVDIYVVPTSSTHYVKYSVLESYANFSGNAPVFYEDPTPAGSQPTPWVDATPANLHINALSVGDAATTRTNLGIVGAEYINVGLKGNTAAGYYKICRLNLTAGGRHCSANIDVALHSTSSASELSPMLRVLASIYHGPDMGTPLSRKEIQFIRIAGASSAASIGYVVAQDDATAKIVDVYLYSSSAVDRARYTVTAYGASNSADNPLFYSTPAVETSQPAGYTAGSPGPMSTGKLTVDSGDLNVNAGAIQTAGVTRISNGGAGSLTTLNTTGLATLNSLKVTGQAGTGNRLVQAGADGTQSASIPVPTAFAQTLLDDADAAAARATLGAASSVGNVCYKPLITTRRTVSCTYDVAQALIDAISLPAGFWSAGKMIHLRFQVYTAYAGMVEIKFKGNCIATISLPAVTRGQFEVFITCQSSGASGRFAFHSVVSAASTSAAINPSPYFGDSSDNGGAWGYDWSVDTGATSSITCTFTRNTEGTNNVDLTHASMTVYSP